MVIFAGEMLEIGILHSNFRTASVSVFGKLTLTNMADGKNFDMIYNKHFHILYITCIYTQKHRQYLHRH